LPRCPKSFCNKIGTLLPIGDVRFSAAVGG
jgi:hypothetical protein